MGQHDDIADDETRDLPESVWFEALGIVPLMAVAAYVVGAWLPALY